MKSMLFITVLMFMLIFKTMGQRNPNHPPGPPHRAGSRRQRQGQSLNQDSFQNQRNKEGQSEQGQPLKSPGSNGHKDKSLKQRQNLQLQEQYKSDFQEPGKKQHRGQGNKQKSYKTQKRQKDIIRHIIILIIVLLVLLGILIFKIKKRQDQSLAQQLSQNVANGLQISTLPQVHIQNQIKTHQNRIKELQMIKEKYLMQSSSSSSHLPSGNQNQQYDSPVTPTFAYYTFRQHL